MNTNQIMSYIPVTCILCGCTNYKVKKTGYVFHCWGCTKQGKRQFLVYEYTKNKKESERVVSNGVLEWFRGSSSPKGRNRK